MTNASVQTRRRRANRRRFFGSMAAIAVCLVFRATCRADTANTECAVVESELEIQGAQWQGVQWRHTLRAFHPGQGADPRWAFVYATGDTVSPDDSRLLSWLACEANILTVAVTGIPNQPAFGGKKEGALLAYSFEQYRQTGDDEWPMLEPMVSGMRASMDTVVKTFRAGRYGFIVAGTSKRGWTALLTAARDERVRAVMASSFDLLNVPVQIEHARTVYGKESSKLSAYADLGLLDRLTEPRIKHLLERLDPYNLRARLSMPKLLVVGANDPYWVVDSMSLYWNDLLGSKTARYVPNQGHGPLADPAARETVGGWVRSIVDSSPLPEIEWSYSAVPDGRLGIVITPKTGAIEKVTVWTAESDSYDFRKARWSPAAATCRSSATALCTLQPKTTPFRAVFAEVSLKRASGEPVSVTTTARVQ